MKSFPLSLSALLLTMAGLLLPACEKETFSEDAPLNGNTELSFRQETCVDLCPGDIFDFSTLEPESVIEEINGVTLDAFAIDNLDPLTLGDPLEIRVFDTDRSFQEARGACATFNDDDLLFKDGPFGNVLIIQDEVRPDCANDRADGGIVLVDFTALGTVSISCMQVFDTDDPIDEVNGVPVAGAVLVFDENGNQIGDLKPIPAVDNGGTDVVEINESGIVQMLVVLLSSGAITDICIEEDDNDPGCTYTQGRWKNKQVKDNAWCVPFDQKFESWRNGDGWLEILRTPPKGNAWYILAHQYIAAYLNVTCLDADTDEIQETYNAAADFLNETRPDEKLSKDERADAIQWSEILDDFNNGLIGPGHCEKMDDKDMDKPEKEEKEEMKKKKGKKSKKG